MLSWRSIVVKIFLWALNILFVLTSLITFTIGVRLLHDIYERRMVDPSVTPSPPPNTNQSTLGPSPAPATKSDASNVAISMIAIGVLVLGAALFAILSVIKDRTPLLTIYLYFLSACTFVTLVLVIVLAFLVPDVLRNIRASMSLKLEVYTEHYDARFLWYYLQYYFFCCGVNNYEDWHGVLGTNNYPMGCCLHADNITTAEAINWTQTCSFQQLRYTDGCFTDANMMRFKSWIFSILILILLVIIIILTLSCILERDRKLEIARTVCLQYASHLNTCRQKQFDQEQRQRGNGRSKISGDDGTITNTPGVVVGPDHISRNVSMQQSVKGTAGVATFGTKDGGNNIVRAKMSSNKMSAHPASPSSTSSTHSISTNPSTKLLLVKQSSSSTKPMTTKNNSNMSIRSKSNVNLPN